MPPRVPAVARSSLQVETSTPARRFTAETSEFDNARISSGPAQRAEIGVRGYDDRIYRRKAKATPKVHALTAEAERLLTLRETHRLNDIPAVAFHPAP